MFYLLDTPLTPIAKRIEIFQFVLELSQIVPEDSKNLFLSVSFFLLTIISHTYFNLKIVESQIILCSYNLINV